MESEGHVPVRLLQGVCMSLFQVTCRYEIRPASELPDGKFLHVVEQPGVLLVIGAEHHLEEPCRDQLNDFHDRIFGGEMFLQDWNGPDRLSLAKNASEGTFRARYVLVDDEVLPAGIMCWPISSTTEWVWLIRKGQMSKEAVADINEYLDAVIPGGGYRLQGP